MPGLALRRRQFSMRSSAPVESVAILAQAVLMALRSRNSKPETTTQEKTTSATVRGKQVQRLPKANLRIPRTQLAPRRGSREVVARAARLWFRPSRDTHTGGTRRHHPWQRTGARWKPQYRIGGARRAPGILSHCLGRAGRALARMRLPRLPSTRWPKWALPLRNAWLQICGPRRHNFSTIEFSFISALARFPGALPARRLLRAPGAPWSRSRERSHQDVA